MKIKRVFLARKARKNKLAQQLIASFKPGQLIESENVLLANAWLRQFPDPWAEGKQSLFLADFPGRFLEPCPCAREYYSCGYWNLHPVVGCPIDCSYCILQGYLTAYPIQVYLNLDDLFKAAVKFRTAHPGTRLRLGTGQLADSLALEPELGIAAQLINFFQQEKNFVFELKTKTDHINILSGFAPSEKIVVSWSMNCGSAALTEEKSAAKIYERLSAAQKLARRGWLLGFHFDPLLDWPGQASYLALIDEIFETVPASQIAWISLGALRFPARLKPLLKERHPESRIPGGELFPGRDGKLRYLRPLREKLYRSLLNRVREHAPRVLVYLCMESEQMWQNLLGAPPGLIRKELALPLSERKHFRPG